MSNLSGNKGEWSEVYAFLKLLGDGRIYAADADLNRREDIFYNIIEIIRDEEVGILHFEIDSQNNEIRIGNDDDSVIEISASRFSEEAQYLLDKICASGASSFTVEHTSEFMGGILCKRLKAPSQDKSDITIKVHDFNTSIEPILGFSIKSRLGKPATLLNAGKTTNFVFEIQGPIYDGNITNINDLILAMNSDPALSESTVWERINFIREEQFSLIYHDMVNSTFKNNLVLVDADLPKILGNLLIQYYVYGKAKMLEALADVTSRNPVGYDLSQGHRFYEYKVKKFLTESALGMLPATVWTGRAEANGGYIVVKEDGDVLCYHLFNRNDFEDYLLNNTRFEQASTSRHDFGEVYRDGDKFYIKLNLQIRFVK
jgi:hypothetical protein